MTLQKTSQQNWPYSIKDMGLNACVMYNRIPIPVATQRFNAKKLRPIYAGQEKQTKAAQIKNKRSKKNNSVLCM